MNLDLLFRRSGGRKGVLSLIMFTMIILFITPSAFAAAANVKGVVKSSSGSPLIGAAVVVKGSSVGTSTDIDGAFTLPASSTDVLSITYLGYEEKEITVGSQSNIEITLESNSIEMSDVVVVAFGTQNKSKVTGSISSISGELLEARPVTNVSSALQGAVPGLNFSVNDLGGELNNSMEINIRGAGSVGDGSSSSPLILIDGIEGDMDMLNPNDIESISVLKDAAASSIYGSKAPFGVILITTKRGEEGRVKVSYNNDFRLSTPISVPNQMNSIRFAYMYNDAFTNAGQATKISDETIAKMVQYQNGELAYGTEVNSTTGAWLGNTGSYANTDWFDVYYKDMTFSQTHSLSLSGGNEKLNYFFSGRYLDQGGLMRYGDDNINRFNFTGKLSAQLSPKARLSYNVRWSQQNYDAPSYLSYYFYHQIQRGWPTMPVYDPNGYFTDESDIYRLTEGGRKNERKETMTQTIDFKYNPTERWSINLDATMATNVNDTQTVKLPVYYYNAAGEATSVALDNTISAGTSRVAEEVARPLTYTVNAYTDYSQRFNDDHTLTALVGFNAQLILNETLFAQRDDLMSTSVASLNTTTGISEITYTENERATAGFFSRINYDYKGIYMIEANLRYDGSSRFTGSDRWNFFPSVSAGYNLAATDLLGDWKRVVNVLKFRVSWGSLGNENTWGGTSNGSYYPFYETMPYTVDGGVWALNGTLPDYADIPSLISSSLTWETIETLNFGFDFGLWSNRLTGKVDLFSRKTKDMIGPAASMPSVLGIDPPDTNNADLESKGYEIELSWRDKIGDFKYGIGITFADDIQTVTSYPNADGSINTWGGGSGWYDGKRYGEIWGYETVGIARSQAEMDAHLTAVGGQSALGDSWGAGDIMYADRDGVAGVNNGANSVNDHGDLMVIGNESARCKYGINIDASWRGFDFSMFWQGVGKRDYMMGYDGTATSTQQSAGYWGVVMSNAQTVAFEEHFDYYRPEGHPLGANLDSFYPRPYSTSDKNHWNQSGYLIDASYLRLKNLQFGYTIPSHLTSKIGIERVRVYFSGDNLLTFTNVPAMFDPETLGGTWGAGKSYPLSRVYSFGMNVNF